MERLFVSLVERLFKSRIRVKEQLMAHGPSIFVPILRD